MSSTEKDIKIELAVKHITGNATEGESLALQQWLSEDSDNLAMYNELKELWEISVNTKNSPEIDINREWSDFKKINIGLSLRRRWISIAAMVAIILTISSVLIITSAPDTKTVTAYNNTLIHQFKDGSEIAIKKESSVSFPAEFSDNERKIILTGEGWFKVTHDTSRPFIVETENYLVEVLGTSFFVKEITENEGIIVSVETGRVAIKKKNKNDMIVITAGETATCSKKSSEIKPSDNSILNDYSWRTNRLVFDNSSLSDIAVSLKKFYGIHIIFSDTSLANCRITTTLTTNEPTTILNIIVQTLGWEYKNEGDYFLITGKACK